MAKKKAAVKAAKPRKPRSKPTTMSDITRVMSWLTDRSHKTAVEKGWWKSRDAAAEVLCRYGENLDDFHDAQSKIALLGLIHSEVSEAIEAVRNNIERDDKVPAFTGLEAELADVLIRIFDMCGAYQLRLGPALIAKMAMNETRSHMHGGKLA